MELSELFNRTLLKYIGEPWCIGTTKKIEDEISDTVYKNTGVNIRVKITTNDPPVFNLTEIEILPIAPKKKWKEKVLEFFTKLGGSHERRTKG